MPEPTDPTAFVRQTMPLCATFDIRAERSAPQETVLEMDWSEQRCTVGGLTHGGALMALADSAGAVVAYLNLPEGAQGTSTIESKTNFVGAMRSGTAVATARPLHVGRSTIVVETEIRVDGRLITKTTQTQAVLSGSA